MPHFSQLSWHFGGETTDHSHIVVVEGNSYVVGSGDPGRDINGACENNCLIDSLKQCLRIDADCRQVRRDLINEFAGATTNVPALVRPITLMSKHIGDPSSAVCSGIK